MENLIESAMIFGLPAPSRVELDSCRNEIKLIKVENICVVVVVVQIDNDGCIDIMIYSNYGIL